ncbi:ribosomal RNA small subunit methyltransferase A [Candidatus Kaiserbacteria bacterium]|nr:ribosomal RNA small subunit methyltransferase A [Candidatus Kaiserbacteria bacterium]
MGQRLGQHFLKNPHYARILAEAAKLGAGDTVVEIGPGTGALTQELLATGARVIAIEKDERLAANLIPMFEREVVEGRFKILPMDIRDFDPRAHGLKAGGYVVAANIPYYITGEIIRKFLEERTPPSIIALLIQKEVADRIVSKKESILSISVKAYGTPKIIAKVSRGNFSPPPSVDSSIILIDKISKKNFKKIHEQRFFEVVRAGFASKRKQLLNNLGVKFGRDEALHALKRAGVSEKARAETVSVDEWFKLAGELHD